MDEDVSPVPAPRDGAGTARQEPDAPSRPLPPPQERRRYQPLRGMEELVDDFLQ